MPKALISIDNAVKLPARNPAAVNSAPLINIWVWPLPYHPPYNAPIVVVLPIAVVPEPTCIVPTPPWILWALSDTGDPAQTVEGVAVADEIVGLALTTTVTIATAVQVELLSKPVTV